MTSTTSMTSMTSTTSVTMGRRTAQPRIGAIDRTLPIDPTHRGRGSILGLVLDVVQLDCGVACGGDVPLVRADGESVDLLCDPGGGRGRGRGRGGDGERGREQGTWQSQERGVWCVG